MQHRTPVDRAVATYCRDWQIVPADKPGVCKVNPETLNAATLPDLVFRYIDISSVTRGVIDWESVQKLRFADAPSRARRVVRPGDVLLCTVRPLLGSHAAATWTNEEGSVCSTGFAVIRPCSLMNPRFLRHLPFCEQVSRQLVAWQCGTNYPAVNETDVRRLQLPLPSTEEQGAIARLLDAVDDTIACAIGGISDARTLLRALQQRFFFDALGETAYADRPTKELPAGWQLLPTGSLLSAEPKNGVSPKAYTQPPGTPTFSIAAVRDGHVDLDNEDNLKFADIPDKAANAYRVQRGDVLIVRGNANPNLVGKAGMIDRFPSGCIYPDITKRVTFKQGETGTVSPDFAVIAWNHSVVHNQVLRRAKTSNGTLKINNRDVKEIVMPVPPPDEQAACVAMVKAAEDRIDSLARVIAAHQRLKKSLLHDLLTGAVRVKASLSPIAEAV